MKKALLTSLLFIFIFILTGCPEDSSYTVTFDSQGGTEITSLEVTKDQTGDEPLDPTKEGYRFKGWYTEVEYEIIYDFSAFITSDLTLYAKWEVIPELDCSLTPFIQACIGQNKGNPPGLVTVLAYLPSETTTITLWHAYSTASSELLNQFIIEFELEYPNIKVNAQNRGYFNEIPGDVVTAYHVNQAPTMVLAFNDDLAKIQNIIVPLDDFIYDAKHGIDISDFILDFKNEVSQYELGYMKSLPFTRTTDIVMINKDIFEANGLTVKTDSPYTWAELEILADTLVGTGPDQCEYLINYDIPATLFSNSVNQWNGGYTSSAGDILLDNTNTKAMLEYIKLRFEDKTFALPLTWDERYASENFKAEDVCMTVGNIGTIKYHTPVNFEMVIGMLPQYDLNNQVNNQLGSNIALIDGATDEENLAAWMFMSFITNTENSARWATNSTNYIPVRYSSLINTFYQYYLNDNLDLDPNISKALRIAVSQVEYYQYIPSFYIGPTAISSIKVKEEAANAIELLWTGNFTVDEILASMIENLE